MKIVRYQNEEGPKYGWMLDDKVGEIQGNIFGEYRRREAKGIQSPAETLRLGHGSCRDFAWLMIEAARALGFAALGPKSKERAAAMA